MCDALPRYNPCTDKLTGVLIGRNTTRGTSYNAIAVVQLDISRPFFLKKKDGNHDITMG